MSSTRSPYFSIKLNGRDLEPTTVRQVLQIRITANEKKADTGQILFRDPDFELFDSRMFSKGRELTFVMGWHDELEPRGPFVIKKYKVTAPMSGNPTLTIEFQDRSHNLNRVQKQRRLVDEEASEIVKQVATQNGMGFDIQTTGTGFSEDRPLMQANITDARMLQNLSDRYGYVWGVEGNTLYFRQPASQDKVGVQSVVRTLSYRINDRSLQSFEPEIKFLSGRKRAGAKQKLANVDLLGTEPINDAVDAAVDAVSGIIGNETVRATVHEGAAKLGEVVKTAIGEDTDDDEAQGSTDTTTDTGDQRKERSNKRMQLDDSKEGLIKFETEGEIAEKENVESEPGDTSGAATPDNSSELAKRNAGNVTKSTDMIEARAQLTTASMVWRAGDGVIVAGVGERLSGKYRVGVCEQVISNESFRTTMVLRRRSFRPDADSKAKIAEAAEIASLPSEEQKAAVDNSAPVNPVREKRLQLDPKSNELASFTKLVDGQEA